MGAVFAATDTALARRVAIKLLHAAGDDVSQARLEREAQAMARLNHPHVVTVYELGDWAGGRYLAMELVDGKTLDAWLPGHDERARRDVLLGAGKGLAEAHRAGVVHRDFKPGNLLVGADGRARVTDFGLARPLVLDGEQPTSDLLATQHGALVGTPAWMSPEQLDGKVADARSDQFAFCVVWAEALTGRRPFTGKSRDDLRAAMRGVPVLERPLTARERVVLTRGLSEDPAARYPTMAALLAALDAKPRVRGLGFALGVFAVLLVLVAAWGFSARNRGGEVKLVTGQMQSLDVECLERVAIGDGEIADVKTLGHGELLIVAQKVGETTLIVWGCEGRRDSYTVRVSAP